MRKHRFIVAVSVALASASAHAQSLDSEVASAPAAEQIAPIRVSAAPATVPAFDANQYHQRSTTLFGVASLGVGSIPGINPYWNPGINLAFTVRSLWSGFVLDAGLDVLFSGACIGRSCSVLLIQPSIRAGYSGTVNARVALGFRAGYSPGLALGNAPAGLLHQLDGDLHVTAITARGAVIEPFLGGGVLIASPLLPVAILGLRIGASL